MPCPSLVKKRGNKRYTLSISCPSCYAGIEKRVFKEGKGKVAGCMKWSLPKKWTKRKNYSKTKSKILWLVFNS